MLKILSKYSKYILDKFFHILKIIIRKEKKRKYCN